MKASLLVLAVSTFAATITRAATPVTLANFPNSVVYALQTDAAGNIYVAGFQGNFLKANPFVAKLSPAGQTLYSTTFAGSNFGIAWAIAVDSAGAAYVFGNTNSPDFPVTPGALQTTMQGSFQGFVSKLDSTGKIFYSTFVGGPTDVTPGLTSAPGLDSILVDSAGDVIITGQAGSNAATGSFPPAPYAAVSSNESFVLKLDPAGAKILGAIGGVGGMIAMDSQGNIYVTGLQYSGGLDPLSPTPHAFQGEPANTCGLLGAFFTCSYQYVAGLNPGLNRVLYATYRHRRINGAARCHLPSMRGETHFVASTTNSPDYPTTASNAYEPQYIASAAPSLSCFFMPNCVNLPPASGYLTGSESQPEPGSASPLTSAAPRQIASSLRSSCQNAIYLGGSVRDRPISRGFAGYPQQCLPQTYATRPER